MEPPRVPRAVPLGAGDDRLHRRGGRRHHHDATRAAVRLRRADRAVAGGDRDQLARTARPDERGDARGVDPDARRAARAATVPPCAERVARRRRVGRRDVRLRPRRARDRARRRGARRPGRARMAAVRLALGARAAPCCARDHLRRLRRVTGRRTPVRAGARVPRDRRPRVGRARRDQRRRRSVPRNVRDRRGRHGRRSSTRPGHERSCPVRSPHSSSRHSSCSGRRASRTSRCACSR